MLKLKRMPSVFKQQMEDVRVEHQITFEVLAFSLI